MEVRYLVEGDYEQFIVPMWKGWNSQPPPEDFLPDVGMIVFDKDVPVCAGYAYVTNSSVSWMEWIVSNKKYTNRIKRKKCLHLLLDTLTNVCIESGYKYIFAVIKSEPLIKIYEEAGFNKAAQGYEMFKKLV